MWKLIGPAMGLVMIVGVAAHAGNLTPPPGAPSKTMKTLQQIEPRTPLSAETTPGDAISIFRIQQPGSYYLEGDLVGQSGVAAVRIEVADVTVDLKGFTISGADWGVIATSAAASNVTVRNGTIRDIVFSGVSVLQTTGARVDGVHALDCGQIGIAVGADAVVTDCLSRGNGAGFISTVGGATFVRCKATECEGSGFDSSDGTRGVAYDDCTSNGNGGSGFGAGSTYNVVIRRCVAIGNGIYGASVGTRAMVTDSKFSLNGWDGLSVLSYGLASRNLCTDNGTLSGYLGAGIVVRNNGNRIEDNSLVENEYGLRANDPGVTDNIIVRNSARENSSANFLIGSGNEAATVVTNPGSNGFGTATAWSNFSY